jgi:hypothetical protein
MKRIWRLLTGRASGAESLALLAGLRRFGLPEPITVWLYGRFAPALAGGDTQTVALADAILKDLYVGPIVETLNQKTYLLDQIERDSEQIDLSGRQAKVPVRTGRNKGRGSRADNSDLPVAGRQETNDAEVTIRHHYIGIELTDPVIEATKRNEGAFISAVRLETEGAADDLRKDINRQCFGTGDGLLANVAAAANNTTGVTLDSVQYIAVGDPISFRTVASPYTAITTSSDQTVTARTGGSTKTIAVGAAVTVATPTHGVFLQGAAGNEMDGLRNITAQTGTLHNIARSGNTYWQGQQQDAASAVAGESLFEALADDIGAVGRTEVEVFLTTRGIRRRLADTYQSQKRFNDARAVEVHGGYSAIMVNEIPVVADDDAPTGFVFAINKSSLKWFELAEPGWLEQGDGRILTLKDASTAQRKMNVWQGWFRWYAALGCTAPNRNGRIISCTDSNPA